MATATAVAGWTSSPSNLAHPEGPGHRPGPSDSSDRPGRAFDGRGGARHARPVADNDPLASQGGPDDPSPGRAAWRSSRSSLAPAAAPRPVLTDPKDIVAQSVGRRSRREVAPPPRGPDGSSRSTSWAPGARPGRPPGDDRRRRRRYHERQVQGLTSARSRSSITGDLVYVGSDRLRTGSGRSVPSTRSSLADLAKPDPRDHIAGAQPAAQRGRAVGRPVGGHPGDSRTGLAKLTVPPVKDADEKIGDQDCYEVTIKLSQADVIGASPSLTPIASGMTFSATIEVWVRKSDMRPPRSRWPEMPGRTAASR